MKFLCKLFGHNFGAKVLCYKPCGCTYWQESCKACGHVREELNYLCGPHYDETYGKKA